MSESIIIHNHSLGAGQEPEVENDGVRYDFRGDYLGFTFNGVHSSKLGIVRVSDGDRYNKELLPTFSDITATVPGLDKTYYFGSTYTQKTITVKFAFDSLTDAQIREMRKLFSSKKPQGLIFDEAPYKVYSVKVNNPPKLSYLCFEEEEQRLYKGDGEIDFVAYSPFARSRFKYLDDYDVENIPEWKGSRDDNFGIFDNKEEWANSSGLVSSNSQIDYGSGTYEIIDASYYYDSGSSQGCYISLYNPSDFFVPAKILIQFNDDDLNDIDELTISLNNGDEEISNLTFDISKIKENEDIKGLVINSSSRLVYPLFSKLTTDWSIQNKQYYNNSINWNYNKNIIYNKYIVAGDFFDIPVCSLQDKTYICIEKIGYRLAIDYKYLYY